MERIANGDLPGLFRAADRASIEAQKVYSWLVRGDLSLIVVAAVCTSWAVRSQDLRMILAMAGAGAFLAALVLTGFVHLTNYDKEWFAARAVAESVKKIAWMYMTGSAPFFKSLPDNEADVLFCRELESILREHSQIAGTLGRMGGSAQEITEWMREARSGDLDTRRQVYIRDRIQDQRQWYGDRASDNLKASKGWLTGIAAIQLLGALAAVALALRPGFGFNVAAVLASVAAAFLAWLQLKRHRELANEYGLAARVLSIVETKARHINSEPDMSAFVEDTEAAISREHTMWLVTRQHT